jgi:hypothetical protein
MTPAAVPHASPVTGAAPQGLPCAAGEWIRIYAMQLALRHADLSPQEAIKAAIDEYRKSGHLAPEQVVAFH